MQAENAKNLIIKKQDANKKGDTTVYPEESYQDDLANAPDWMIIPPRPPARPPPPPPPQDGCSIM